MKIKRNEFRFPLIELQLERERIGFFLTERAELKTLLGFLHSEPNRRPR
jgi:hypothetical protein